MTLSSANNRNDYTGNGAVDTYSYTFKIFSDSDLLVTQRNTDDVETTLVLNTDYTVTGAGDAGGGTIVLTAGNLTTDYLLSVRRVRDLTQETDIRNQGDFYPEGHEDFFDHAIMVDQQQQDEIDRSLRLAETVTGVDNELPIPEANRVLRWNGDADAIENVDVGSVILATPASESIIADMIDVDDIVAIADKLLVLKLTGGTLTGPLLWNESGDEYLRLPRLTTTERDALTPGNGFAIYNTTLNDFQIYQDSAWLSLASITGTETLTNKTLTTPTLTIPIIVDFTSATHTHNDVSNGGYAIGVIQAVHTQTGAVNTGTTQIPIDDSIPQITEGDEYMTLPITPKDATHKLIIEVVVIMSHTAASYNAVVALFQDSTADALAVAANVVTVTQNETTVSFKYEMTAGTTSSTTFRVRAGSGAAGTTTFNGAGGARRFGGVLASSIRITEIK